MQARIAILLNAAGETRFPIPAILRGCPDQHAKLLDDDTSLVNRRFPGLACGQTGGRSLLLTGASLPHAAAEFGEAASVSPQHNARADLDRHGIGGQTAIFHALAQFDDIGLPAARP